MAWVIYRFSKKCESVMQITNFWKIFFFFKDMTWQRLQMSDWQSWAKSQVQQIEPGTGYRYSLSDFSGFHIPPLTQLFMWTLDVTSPNSQGCPGHEQISEMALTCESFINAHLRSPRSSLPESQISFLSTVLFEHIDF